MTATSALLLLSRIVAQDAAVLLQDLLSRQPMFSKLTVLPVLVIGLAIPATAQQTSDQEAQQIGERLVQAYNKAGQGKDAAELAAAYTADAILVTPQGPLVGREAIEKYFTETFKAFSLKSAKLHTTKIIANGQVMLRTGSFSGTLQEPRNGSVPIIRTPADQLG